MSVVLFVVELGSGYGHIKRFLPIARAAAIARHRPLFLVTNPEESGSVLDGEDFEVRSAPYARWQSRARANGIATSYADIIGSAGFGDRELLREMIDAWDALLKELRPAAVVAELSPFLNLATYGSDLPILNVGHGFALPPPHLPRFPTLWEGSPLYDESDLLENAAAICTSRGRAALSALPALLEGTAHAVTGLEVLDPYRAQRRQRPVGPPALDASLAREPPQDDVFAYLQGDMGPTTHVLRALAMSGLRGRAFIRRGTRAHREALAGSNVAYLERPIAIGDALNRARLVVHHGSMLTSEEALASGRPQIVVPLYLEHLFTALALRGLGVGLVARPSLAEAEVRAILTSTDADAELSTTAAAFAEAFWQTSAPSPELPARLLEMILPK